MPIRFPEDEPTLAHFRKAEEGGGEESALLVRHSGLPQMHMHMHTYIYAYIYIDPPAQNLMALSWSVWVTGSERDSKHGSQVRLFSFGTAVLVLQFDSFSRTPTIPTVEMDQERLAWCPRCQVSGPGERCPLGGW